MLEVLADFNTPQRPVSVVSPPTRHMPPELKVFIEWLSGALRGHSGVAAAASFMSGCALKRAVACCLRWWGSRRRLMRARCRVCICG
ncbi:hypothetical protein FSB08_32010 [Paraburkholderia sp. JPY432]|uniref:hypothetical protein n=1 Tax=Paraburkholderia TaxID=1822464 RepID=UPI0015951312|nr:hypothetical protein [Paraburkholderia youngii]NVH77017.1 hypothetical protein [Paraburkholderia youngii]